MRQRDRNEVVSNPRGMRRVFKVPRAAAPIVAARARLPFTLPRVALSSPVGQSRRHGRARSRPPGGAAERTGVERGRPTAVSVAGLTLYDMLKAVERGARLTDVRLVHKSGGRSGEYRAS